jgi:2-polyprenyl-6-methoxyphenol hydroxylase-like FAD-dependent oxidoreductase
MPLARKFLIGGGGVGGMSLAICLARQQRAVELIDLDPEWRAVGAGLSLNNATSALSAREAWHDRERVVVFDTVQLSVGEVHLM